MRSRLKKVDLLLIALFVVTLLSYFFLNPFFSTILWIFLVMLVIRLLFLAKKRLFWKVRNRLIFSSLFFIVTPIFFLTIFYFIVANIVVAQYGTIIFDNIMNSRLLQIENILDQYLKLNDSSQIVYFMRRWQSENPDYMQMTLIEKSGQKHRTIYKHPRSFDESNLKLRNYSGYFTVNDVLYHGAIRQNSRFVLLLCTQINQVVLDELSAISDFRIKYRNPTWDLSGIEMELNNELSESGDSNFFAFPWVYKYQFLDFSPDTSAASDQMRQNSFWLLIDYDKLFTKIKDIDPGLTKNNLKKFVYFLMGLFGTFIILSFFIGFRMIRVITRSINQITGGIQKIRKGDFSFRIRTKSNDQLQFLAESFNEMAAGINRLLVEEKERHRLEEELRIARSIQLKLLPKEMFTCDEFDVSAVNIPADEIAGDYFDYFYSKNDFISVIVADVSGKGASAAFYMAELKGLMNYLQILLKSPAEMIRESHSSLSPSFEKTTFITMSIAKFMVKDKRFVFARAGHTPGLYYNSRKNECVELNPSGSAIGLLKFAPDRIDEISLPYCRGDILFLFSDGLSEIMNEKDEILGMGNLKNLLAENHTLDAAGIKQKILDFSIKFSESAMYSDDLTFIILKVK